MLRFVRRRRLVRATAVMCLTVAVALLYLIIVCLFDRVIGFSVSTRLICWMILIGIMSAALARVAWLLTSREYDPILAAARIEKRVPELKDQLVTVVTQRMLPESQQASPDLTAAVARDAAQTLTNYPPEGLITSRASRPAEIVLVAAVVLSFGLSFIPGLGLPSLVARILTPLADIAPVTTTTIRVTTGSVEVPQGAPLAIVADATNTDTAILLIGPDESTLTPIPMPRIFAGRFALTLAAVERNLIYRVRAGDAESGAFEIRTRAAAPSITAHATPASPDPSGELIPEGFERRVSLYHRLVRAED